VCGTLTGCRSNSDLVESELRSKDTDLRKMDEALRQSKAYNRYLQHEIQQWQQAASGHAIEGVAVPPCPLKSVQLGRQTGGLDEDGMPGDEAVQVVIEPRDFDNHPLKAPGGAQIQALEITGEGVKKPLGQWTVPAEEMRRHWRSGLLSTGYFLIFPWQCPPSSARIRVVVQWVGPDGKPFEAERDVTVKPLPAALRKQVDEVIPLMPKTIPAMPGPGSVLPMPKPEPETVPLPKNGMEKLPEPNKGPELPLPDPAMINLAPRMAANTRPPAVTILPPRP